jgi:hypothetical protein
MEKWLEIAAADFAKWHNDTLSHTTEVTAVTKHATVAAELPATNPPLKSIAISATALDRRGKRQRQR